MKKTLWRGLCFMMAITLALCLTGCSKQPDSSGEPESSDTLVVVDPDLDNGETAPSPESEPPSSAGQDESSSETDAAASDDTGDTTPSVTDSAFAEAFDDNPIDAAFTQEISSASTSKEMQTVLNQFAEIWETEVTVADKKAKRALQGTALSQYSNSQQQWENNKESALDQLRETIQNEFGGSTAALEMSQQTLSFYRARVREIYRAMYNETGTLPTLQYETAVG